jgi:hypothetical protein
VRTLGITRLERLVVRGGEDEREVRRWVAIRDQEGRYETLMEVFIDVRRMKLIATREFQLVICIYRKILNITRRLGRARYF